MSTELKISHTHVGRRGLHYRDSIDVDGLLNRKRRLHAVNELPAQAYAWTTTYKALCGIQLSSSPEDDSVWADVIAPVELGWRVSCKRCRRVLSRAES
jgi:hypothetical protein